MDRFRNLLYHRLKNLMFQRRLSHYEHASWEEQSTHFTARLQEQIKIVIFTSVIPDSREISNTEQ